MNNFFFSINNILIKLVQMIIICIAINLYKLEWWHNHDTITAIAKKKHSLCIKCI